MLNPLLQKLQGMRIILATSSVQRAKVLEASGLTFEKIASNFEEDLDPNMFSISDFVEQTALGKVQNIYNRCKENSEKPADIIIGVDTMVSYNGKIYGKPKTEEEAVNVITKLTGSRIPHMVYSGVVLLYEGKYYKFTEVTTVYMRKLSELEIAAYVDTGEPFGKAGGYAIQGIASSFIERIDGDYNNVIGLPLFKLTEKLREIFNV